MGEPISLKNVMTSIKRKLLLVVGIVLIGGALGWGYTEYVAAPMYKSSTEILISQNVEAQEKELEQVIQPDVQASLDLINTYKAIIFSPVILDDVREELGLSLTEKELEESIKISNEEGSQLLIITATNTNAGQAAEIANKTVEILQAKTSSLMKMSKVTVLSAAERNYTNLSSTMIFNISYGILAGLVVGTTLVLVLEYLDPAVKRKEDFDKIEMPVLGSISHVSQRDKADKYADLQRSLKKGELDVVNKTTI